MEFLTVLVCVLYMTLTTGQEPEDWHGKYDKVFPGEIPGPEKLSDKIGIVGAGPAGIHMAYLLKRRGFKNVEILESSNRLGMSKILFIWDIFTYLTFDCQRLFKMTDFRLSKF